MNSFARTVIESELTKERPGTGVDSDPPVWGTGVARRTSAVPDHYFGSDGMSRSCIAAFYGGPLDGKEQEFPDTIYYLDVGEYKYKLDPSPFDTIYDLWDAQKKDAVELVRTLRYIYNGG